MKVFEKQNITDFGVIVSTSTYEHCIERFKYLLNICPESLGKPDLSRNGMLPIQVHTYEGNETGFIMLLEAGLRYSPRKLGFLLHRNRFTSVRTIDCALSRDGLNISPENLFRIIHRSIPPSDDFPILHKVIRFAPKYFSLFWKNYPNAIYLRDDNGRLPLHISLQGAKKWSHPLLSLIAINAPIDRHEKDPVNGLYPFMSAASGKSSDLNVIYFLLQRNTDVLDAITSSL